MTASGAHVVTFAEVGKDDVLDVGGKGASLGELTGVGVNVPPGYVVTTHAYRAALDGLDPDGSDRQAVESLDGTDHEAAAEVGSRIRGRVEQAPMPQEVVNAISAAYEVLCQEGGQADLPVAVRSSATSEDSADASFAGQQDTFLWVRGADEVVDAVRRCWGSLFSTDSITYRRRRNLPEEGLAMAVVVQRMVEARSSGVMFTRSPLSGDRSVVAVDASWVLGSAVVGGEVTPDTFTVSKVTGEVTKRTISTKEVRDVPAPGGRGVVPEPVPAELRDVPAVSDDELHQLVAIGKQVERHYGVPQDIEWAVEEEGGVFLLQSRPETVWAEKDAQAPAAAPAAKAFHHVLAKFGGRHSVPEDSVPEDGVPEDKKGDT